MSRSPEDRVADIFADSGAEVAKLRLLRARIRQLQDQAQDEEEPDFLAAATTKAFELVHILVDEGLLKTRHLGPDGVDRARLLEIVDANTAYLQAAVQAFSA